MRINNIEVFSKGRKHQEFLRIQNYPNASLWIDGKFICRTSKDHTYIFHLINGKIDHFWVVKPEDLTDWELDPLDWCDACIKESVDLPF